MKNERSEASIKSGKQQSKHEKRGVNTVNNKTYTAGYGAESQARFARLSYSGFRGRILPDYYAEL